MKKLILAAALGAVVSTPALAQDSVVAIKDGFRIEGRAHWERINDPEEDLGINYELGSGVSLGGEVGYDFPVSENVLVGPYFNYETSSVESCEGDFCVSSGGYWAAGAQVGIIVGESGMVYGKLGYGQQTVDVVGPLDVDGMGTIVNFDESETGGGYNFGMGYDQSFGSNFYGRVELTVSESYDIYGFDFQRVSGGISLGVRF